MSWVNWVALVNAVLIVAAGVWVFARPPASLSRLTGRAAALFLAGFGLALVSNNVGQIVMGTDVSWGTDFWWTCYVVNIEVGLLSGAAGLVFAFRMREDHNRLAEGVAVGLILLVAVVLASFPSLIIGENAPDGDPAGLFHRGVLVMLVALLLLARLRFALHEGDELHVSELAWTLIGFVPYALYIGGLPLSDFSTDELAPAIVDTLTILLSLLYVLAACVTGLRYSTNPAWHFLAAIAIGIVALVLRHSTPSDLAPLWAAIGRDLLVVGVVLALYQWHDTPEARPRNHAQAGGA